MFIRRLGAIGAVAALTFTMAACGSDDTTDTADGGDTGTGEDTGAGGDDGAMMDSLRIGIKFDQPGLGLREGDAYTGFDVQVAEYIAGQLGVDAANIEWVEAPSAQRETLLETDQVDLVVATYSITDERKERVSFAGPYFIAGQGLLVRADETEITGPDTLEGKVLCSVTGSTPAQRIADEYPGVQLQEYGTYSECLPALLSGQIDAITTDDTILAGYAAQDQYAGQLKLAGEPFSEERYGVGTQKGSELCQEVNAAIEAMIEEGAWEQAVQDTLGAADFTPGPGNPPEVVEDCA
ncbi:transporter substrate-binding domain-containing protein [Nostocoides sp. F2B08]|uniref:glutamate ABC transporter substrate-binding protein n=1 Tax=Nostocoides sp. F2B08 TaxID=2653936 RepID=UPI001263A38D|nr:glutamate ABC transporter substrate-binding protein [Tetrasphaera sp. F2B08]KAB7744715.1 transporter substrate-binding domain-containing protein [Tetrasphaera sp. F2B08]